MKEFISNFPSIWLPKIIFAIIVIFISYLLIIITKKTIRKTILSMRRNKKESQQLLTISHLFSNIVSTFIFFVAIVMILNKFGINTSALVTGAGVIGLAVSFGSQELIRNIISGLFIIIEGLYYIGDTISIDNITGTCEKINLHNTYLRDFTGKLHIIPNGEIRKIANMNRGFLRVIIKVGIDYSEDVEKAMRIMKDIIDNYTDEIKSSYLKESAVQGITELGDSAVYIRGLIKVSPSIYWEANRELNKRVLYAFNENGIGIPYNTQTLILKKEK
ncbi:mechanosensitive ion channel family protein [candidate division WOR-3 bacterium]|nr:mechanosensitive ion channel family protein [candidate division WOR-3 bacterium]